MSLFPQSHSSTHSLIARKDWSSNPLFLIKIWKHFGTGEMTHVIKCLLHKHDNLSLILKQTNKQTKQTWWWVWAIPAPRRQKTRRLLGLTGQQV